MSETLFELLLVGGLLVILRRIATWFSVVAGASLLAAAMLTRAVALPIAVVCVLYLALRRVGWRRVAAGTAVVVVAYGGYGLWFRHYYGQFGITESSGHFLYGRVAPFADCHGLSLTRQEHELCKRLHGNTPTAYTWDPHSGFFTLADQFGPTHADAIASAFARKVIVHQPLTYLRVVALDTMEFFSPVRSTSGTDFPVAAWRLPTHIVKRSGELGVSAMSFNGNWSRPRVDRTLARALLDYQEVVYTYGPLLAGGLLLAGLAAARRLDRPHETAAATPLELCTLAAVAGVLLVLPNATVVFDWRYLLPAIPVTALAAALAAARLWPQQCAEPLQSQHGHATRPRMATSAATGLVVCLLVIVAPVHRNPLYSGYVLAGAATGNLGNPVHGPLPIPGSPHDRYQIYQRGWVAQAEPHGAVVIPPGITAQLTPTTWTHLGPPRACGHLRKDPSVHWCYFARGLLTSPPGLQNLIPPFRQRSH